jgi:hypothetical protein
VGRDELISPDKFDAVSRNWLETIVCPVNAVIIAANAVAAFVQFVNALFQRDVLVQMGRLPVAGAGFGRRISSAVREAIITAGRALQLLRMRYHNVDRVIEPYSFRYKVRMSDGRGFEYFFGYDRTRDQTIKSFFVHEIQSVSILPETFSPRFLVEF